MDNDGPDPSVLLPEIRKPVFGPHVPRHDAQFDEETGMPEVVEEREEDGEPEVSPYELFLDLFFGASLLKLGDVLSENLSDHPVQILNYVLIFILIYESWLKVSSYINRFASGSTSDVLFIACNVISLGGVIVNVPRCMGADGETKGHNCEPLCAWLMLGRASVCVWYTITLAHTWRRRGSSSGKGHRFSRYNLSVCILSMALMAACALTDRFTHHRGPQLALLACAACVEVFSTPVLYHTVAAYRSSYVPVNSELAGERFGLIYIIALGELVMSSVDMTLTRKQGPTRAGRATAVMLLGVALAMLFHSSFFTLYDLRADRAVKKNAMQVSIWRSWATLYFTSLLALLAAVLGAIFRRINHGEFCDTDRQVLSWALCIKVAVFSICSRLHVRHVYLAMAWVADVSAIAAFALVALIGDKWIRLPDLGYLAMSVGIWGCLGVMRGMVLPVKLTEEGVEEAEHLLDDGQHLTAGEHEGFAFAPQ